MSGVSSPRWTHVALPVGDLDATVAWYERFTPLRLLERRAVPISETAWLTHPGQIENPFVLVLVMNYKTQGTKFPQLTPFAHIGIEMPERSDVDRMAELGRADGCLVWEPQDMPPPVGYICALNDPDGNVIEISHDQGVYESVQRLWGTSVPA